MNKRLPVQTTATTATQHVIFIDTGLPDYQTLIDGLPETTDIVRVTPDQDGIQLMAEWAQSHSGYGAIHVVGHGYTGAQQLGSGVLSGDTLEVYKAKLNQIRSALTENGDILLYGCNIAHGQAGKQFIKQLHELSGCNIAAASSRIGHANHDAQWQLTETTGPVTSPIFASNSVQQSWFHHLSDVTHTFDAGSSGAGNIPTGIYNPLGPIDGFTYSITAPGSGTTHIAVYDGGGSGNYSIINLSDRGVQFNFGNAGTDGATGNFDFRITNSSAFKIASMAAEMGQWGGSPGYLTNLTVKGYLNGSPVEGATDTVDFTTGDTTGSVSYTKGVSNSGTLTFNSSWENIDEIRFTGGDNGSPDRGTLILDDIDFDAAIAAPANAAPIASGTHALSTTDEDTTTTGVQVSTIIANGGSAIVSDGDGDTLGIAVTATTGNGSWQFSTDNSNWTAFGAVSGTNSLLLNESTYVRYVPDGDNGESVNITFRGWDQSGAETASSNGSASYANTDSNNGGSNVFSTATASATLTVSALNDAPTQTGTFPSDIAVTEDIAGNFDLSGLTLADVDSTGDMTLTLTATGGTMTASDGGGVVVGGSGSGTLTLTGTIGELDTYLNTSSAIKYTSALNDNGEDAQTVAIKINDGDGSDDVALGSVNMDITAADDTPTLSTGATSLAANEDTATAMDLSNITVADVDTAGDITLTLALTDTNADLTATGADNTVNNVDVVQANDFTVTLTGTVAELNTYLASEGATNISYTTSPDGDTNDTLSITAYDGNSTSSATDLTITVTPVNDAPTVSATSDSGPATGAGSAVSLFSSTTIDPIETENIASVTFTVSGLADTGQEKLNIDGATVDLMTTAARTNATNIAYQVTYNAGTATVVITGTSGNAAVSSVFETALNGITYENTLDAVTTGDRVFTLTNVTDVGTGTNSWTTADIATTISVTNGDTPAASNATKAGTEDTPFTLTNSEIVVAQEANATDALEYITISSVSGGTLAFTGTATTAGTTSSAGSGSVTLVDAAAALTAGQHVHVDNIANIQFTPTANATSDASVVYTVTDAGGDASSAATLTITLAAVADAPTLTGVTTTITALEDTATNLITGTPVFADVDTTADVVATLTATDGSAVLTASDANGVVVGNSGSNAITLTGTAAEINTFLATPSNITYTGSTNNTTADSVVISVNDGEGGTDANATAITVNFTPVNDAPEIVGLNGDSVTASIIGSEYIDDQVGSAVTDISDVDSTDLDGGYLLITQTSGTTDGAFLSDTVNDGELKFGPVEGTADGTPAAGDTVWVNGAAIGTVDSTKTGQGGADLRINLNATSTPGAAGYILSYLKYGSATEGARTFSVTVNDGDGGTSAAASFTVTVIDDTKPTATSYTDSVNEDTAVNLSSTELPTGQDSQTPQDALEYITIDTSTVTGGTLSLDSAGTADTSTVGGIDYDTAAGNLTGTVHINIADIGKLDFTPTADLAGTGAASFDWTVTDAGGHTSSTATYTLDITNTPDAPTAEDGTLNISYNGTHTFTADDFGFSDVDTGDALDHITLKTLPLDGDLLLNDTVITSANTEISLADLNSGLLKFKPDSGGTGNSYASFTFTVNDGNSDSATANTVTLNVAAPPSSGGSSSGTTDTTTDTVDGVEVSTSTDSSGNVTTTIPVVTEDRTEDPNTTTTEADIPLINGDTNNNGNVVTATLPVGVGLSASGPATAQTATDALTTLVQAIDARDNNAEANLIGGAQTFLNNLAATTTLDVRTIVPTTTSTSLTAPVVITGTSSSEETTQSEAFVIDLRSLPSGSTLQLDNIEFASIMGSATVTGGAGRNYVVADDNSQFIVLGADDDELHGGGGDDIVGSRGGDDLLFGDAGNDWLVGGLGRDSLHGGAGDDLLQGSASEAGTYHFLLNSQQDLMVRFTPDQPGMATTLDTTIFLPWLDANNYPAIGDERFAFLAQDPRHLSDFTLLYHAVTDRMPELSELNTWTNAGLNAQGLAAAALDYLGITPDTDPTADTINRLVEQVWQQAPEDSLKTAAQTFFAHGGQWGDALLWLVRHETHTQRLTGETGELAIAAPAVFTELGWLADNEGNQLYGGEGNDRLVAGRSSSLLDGGEGTDLAIFFGAAHDWSITQEAPDHFLVTHTKVNVSHQLTGIELVEFSGEVYGQIKQDAPILTPYTPVRVDEYLDIATQTQLDLLGEAPDYLELF